MAAVHNDGHPHAARAGPHDKVVDVIVEKDAVLRVVHRAKELVHAILLVAILVWAAASVTRVVPEQGVARLCVLHEPLDAIHDVLLGRHRVVLVLVVHERPDLPAVGLALEIFCHLDHVVVAAVQLALLMADVVDADHESLEPAIAVRILNAELTLEIHTVRGRELRDLRVLVFFKILTHPLKQLDPAHVLAVLLNHIQHCRRASSAVHPSIVSIGRGLVILAAREHADVRRGVEINLDVPGHPFALFRDLHQLVHVEFPRQLLNTSCTCVTHLDERRFLVCVETEMHAALECR
mmetsp:Transcript_15649/g.36980  ORF Transcript_15649/g.36980 Transcript_15649/m.36980 type:complete len:294 (+) Transcript_15649:292-1173(+)